MTLSFNASTLKIYILSINSLICLHFLLYLLSFTFTLVSPKPFVQTTSPTVIPAPIMANEISIPVNINATSNPLNIKSNGYLL